MEEETTLPTEAEEEAAITIELAIDPTIATTIGTFVLVMRPVTSRSAQEMMNIIAMSIHKPLTSGKNALSIQAMACRTGQESNENLKPDDLPTEVEEMEEDKDAEEEAQAAATMETTIKHITMKPISQRLLKKKSHPKLTTSIQMEYFLLMTTMPKSSKSSKQPCYHTMPLWKTLRSIP